MYGNKGVEINCEIKNYAIVLLSASESYMYSYVTFCSYLSNYVFIY